MGQKVCIGIYEMPGINHYLNKEFCKKFQSELPNFKFLVRDLVLIDIETFFDFLYLKDWDVKIFEIFLKRYAIILKKRHQRFKSEVNEDNYISSRISFDEIYKTIFQYEHRDFSSSEMIKILTQTIGVNEELLDLF